MSVSRRSLVWGFAAASFAGERYSAVTSLKPADTPAGEKAVLDNLEERARAALAAIRHPASLEEAGASREQLRHLLRASLGHERLPWPPQVTPRLVGEVERSGYRIEKIVFETLPGVEVPAHLYLPAALKGKAPAILFYCGHWWEDSKTRPDFQAFLINMARWGFVALTFDPFGQGERGVSNRDHRRTEMLVAGVSQQGIAVYETQCALALLLARPEVDPRRAGITGASGGGYNTWITAALDDRIAAAVSVVGTSEFYQQIHVCRPLDWYQANEHCHFVPNLIRYANNHELLAMIAPRPLMIIAASQDQSFPVEGVREIFQYGLRLYQTGRKEDGIGFFEDTSAGHGYQQKKREAAYGWFRRWLSEEGDGGPAREPPTETEPWDSPGLRCFPLGQNRPAGPGIVAAAARLVEKTDAREKPDLPGVLGKLPATPATPARVSAAPVQRLIAPAGDGLSLPAFLLRPAGAEKGVILAVDDNGKEDLAREPLLEEANRAGWMIAGVDLRGIGELAITKRGWAAAVSLLLGENFVWRQALDLVSFALGFPAKPAGIYARGHNAALAATYAIHELGRSRGFALRWFVLRDCFLSYRQFVERPASSKDSFALHGGDRFRTAVLDREIPFLYVPFDALRHFDLPQLLDASPARGLIINPIDGDWRRMAENDARRYVRPPLGLACEVLPDETLPPFRRLLNS